MTEERMGSDDDTGKGRLAGDCRWLCCRYGGARHKRRKPELVASFNCGIGCGPLPLSLAILTEERGSPYGRSRRDLSEMR